MPEFKAGDRVRVKDGVADPDAPGFTLSGMTGTIERVFGRYIARIIIDKESLDAMSQEHKKAITDIGIALDAPAELALEEIEPLPEAKAEEQPKLLNKAELVKIRNRIEEALRAIDTASVLTDEAGLEFHFFALRLKDAQGALIGSLGCIEANLANLNHAGQQEA